MHYSGTISPRMCISQLGVNIVSADAKQLFNPVWCLLSDGLDDVNYDENKDTDSSKVYLLQHNSSTSSTHAGHQPGLV